MKKAKVILSGIAVVAVLGGAFAFKAKRENHVLFLGTTSTLCTLRVSGATVGTTGQRFFTSDESTTICPISTLYTTINDNI